MKDSNFTSGLIFLVMAWLIFVPVVQAAPIPEGMPVDQAGDKAIYAKGDEHYCQFYVIGPDKEKYIVVLGEDGKWFYATTDSETGKLVSGPIEIGKFVAPPAEAKNLKPAGLAAKELERQLQGFNQGMDEINARHLKALKENQASGQKTTYQLHTIFVEFPDSPHTYEADQFISMLYSNRSVAPYNQTPDGYPAYGSTRDYWDEVSRGQVDIQAITHYPNEGEWFMMPQTRQYYADNRTVFFDDLESVTGLILDNANKYVLVLAGDAMYAGTLFYPSSYAPPFSNNYYITILTESFPLFRGPGAPQYYFLAMGIAAHEFGHLLFGLQDYAYSTSYWDIMGMGCYGYGDLQTPNSEKPVHPSAIARIRAGFADVQTLSGEGIARFRGFNLADVESTGKVLHLDNQDNDTNFYLEVRQPYNNIFDSDIIGSSAGLVVWFTFQNGARYFPYYGGSWYPFKGGYFNSTTGSYWGDVSNSAFPGAVQNNEIGYSTAPPFTGNNYTNLHHLTNLRKNIKSLVATTPEGEEIIINRFSMNFEFERGYFNEKISVVSLDDDNSGMSQGNGNGSPEIGERIEVVFKIENQGTQIIPAMQGSFDTDSDVHCLTTNFPIEEIPIEGFFQTQAIVFDILLQPVTGGFHVVRFLFDNQFINLPNVRLIFELPNIPIATGSYVQSFPDISGDKIVWKDYRSGNSDLYLYDLATNTERQITNDLTDQISPAISGDKIVWVDYRNGYADVYLYDLTTNTERQITNDTAIQESPAISGDKIIWTVHSDIYLYDLATDTERLIINSNGFYTGIPAISGDKVVWQVWHSVDDTYNIDIYLYDLTTDTARPITNDPAGQASPAISSDKIVWVDYRNGNADIYLYDLATNTERQITNNPIAQISPAISGNKIVWEDRRNGNADIYLYDLATNTERYITNNTAGQISPAIFGDKIVWQDWRASNGDIYMDYDIP